MTQNMVVFQKVMTVTTTSLSAPGSKAETQNCRKPCCPSLCATVANTVLSADEDLTRLNKIIVGQSIYFDTAKPVKSLPALIREAQELLEEDKKALASKVQKFLEKEKVPASNLLPLKIILVEERLIPVK